MFTLKIAKTTYHSKEAVDRYINDFEKVRTLALTRMSESLIEEYLKLCQTQPA